MIELNVAEYCHECPEFDAEVTRVYADNKVVRMVVSCAHWRMCREIHRTVKERLEKEERIKREAAE